MAACSKEDILTILAKHTQAIQSYGVHQYGLFGSFVRNEQQQDSDIDILFGINFPTLVSLQTAASAAANSSRSTFNTRYDYEAVIFLLCHFLLQ